MPVVTPALCSRRVMRTIDHLQVGEGGTYAVLIRAAQLPSDFWDYVVDGNDFCVAYDSAGTDRKPVEKVIIDTVTHDVEVHFAANDLTITSDQAVWFFFGGTDLVQPGPADPYGSQAVWVAVGDLAGVWHLDHIDGGTTWKDSTGVNDGSNSGASEDAGQMGGAAVFASNDSIGIASPVSGTITELTISGWMYRSDAGHVNVLGWGDVNGHRANVLWYSDGSCYWQLENSEGGNYPYSAMAGTGWKSISFVYDGGLARASRVAGYVAGVAQSLTQFGDGNPADYVVTGNVSLGGEPANTRHATGILDEVRIASVARSAEYIATDYAIQRADSDFLFGTSDSEANGEIPGGAPTGGTWTLSYATGGTTTGLSHIATPQQVEDALNALNTDLWSVSGVNAFGANGAVMQVSCVEDHPLSVDDANLVGGNSPDIAIETTQDYVAEVEEVVGEPAIVEWTAVVGPEPVGSVYFVFTIEGVEYPWSVWPTNNSNAEIEASIESATGYGVTVSDGSGLAKRLTFDDNLEIGFRVEFSEGFYWEQFQYNVLSYGITHVDPEALVPLIQELTFSWTEAGEIVARRFPGLSRVGSRFFAGVGTC